jgi:hypothetical protein
MWTGRAPALAVGVTRRRIFQGEPQQDEERIHGANGVHEHDKFSRAHDALLPQPHAQPCLNLQLRSYSIDRGKGGALVPGSQPKKNRGKKGEGAARAVYVTCMLMLARTRSWRLQPVT